MAMLPIPPVEERTIRVNDTRSTSWIRSSYSLFLMFSCQLDSECVVGGNIGIENSDRIAMIYVR